MFARVLRTVALSVLGCVAAIVVLLLASAMYYGLMLGNYILMFEPPSITGLGITLGRVVLAVDALLVGCAVIAATRAMASVAKLPASDRARVLITAVQRVGACTVLVSLAMYALRMALTEHSTPSQLHLNPLAPVVLVAGVFAAYYCAYHDRPLAKTLG